ncbi:DNA-binding transcriptional regulator, LysR family [Cohaesibacter marisflavi]|uniref:DNA-binding transcriptional regulator, LysR family n=1 Tax=Cohaesibacter marisflavi TaxID=655353 RepID=A0A1I5HWH4_9HYPH|nr:LysR family transcriptional regulator [Cohaesibacter marisflavi]SFO52256.1 DNA-binding transcriptional regulator, LysR family [Cohaesibacter marisflavi]
MMKIRELQAFDAYIRLGGMRSAADELGLSQPMISRLLMALETRVGFALFLRKRNKLIPTPEAFQFHQTVVRGLESISALSEEASAIANNQRGHLVIAAQPIFCDTFLIDAIAEFQKTHPHVSVRLRDTGMSEIMRMVAERSCDFALGITLDADPYGADVTSLAICEARCLMPKGHKLQHLSEVSLQNLKRETFVDLAPGSPLRTRIDYMMQSIEVERAIVAETRTLHGVVRLVEMGGGLAIVDPVACLLLDEDKVVDCPLLPSIRWDIAQFVPKDRPLSGIGLAFAEVVATEIGRLKTAGVIL